MASQSSSLAPLVDSIEIKKQMICAQDTHNHHCHHHPACQKVLDLDSGALKVLAITAPDT
jgi:hypothetical protein